MEVTNCPHPSTLRCYSVRNHAAMDYLPSMYPPTKIYVKYHRCGDDWRQIVAIVHFGHDNVQCDWYHRFGTINLSPL